MKHIISFIVSLTIALSLFFVIHPRAAEASCSGTIPNVFTPYTQLATAESVNANFSYLLACTMTVDNTQIGTAGIYASQIIPTTSVQATFGGSIGYTFTSPTGATTPITILGNVSQSQDLFDVDSSTGTKYFAVSATGGITFGNALNVSSLTASGSVTAASVFLSSTTATGGNLYDDGTNLLIRNYSSSGGIYLQNNVGSVNLLGVTGTGLVVPVGASEGYGFVGGTATSLYSDSINTILRSMSVGGAVYINNSAASASNADFPDAGGFNLLRGAEVISGGGLTAEQGFVAATALSSLSNPGIGNGDGIFQRTASTGIGFFGGASSYGYIDFGYSIANTFSLHGNGSAGNLNLSNGTLTTGSSTYGATSATVNGVVTGVSGFVSSAAAGFSMANAAAGGNTILGTGGGAIAGVVAQAFYVYTPNIAVQQAAMDDAGNFGIGGAYYSASERRLKSNIVPLSANDALALLNQTQIVRFCYKTEKCLPGQETHIGFIADDTPTDLAPKHKAMDLGATISTTLEVVKLQQTEIRQLQNQVRRLEKKSKHD